MNSTATVTPLDDFHVILVEPQESRNVGSVARAMQNLGFRHLHLVAPRGYDREKAGVTAVWATAVLDGLRIHDTFADALSDMEEVVGLSEREGRNPAYFVTLPQWSVGLVEREPRRTALVFGPEDNGLRQEHLNQCSWVVRIPSAAENPSFNLAQSVLLVLYKITESYGDAVSLPAVPVHADPRRRTTGVPTWNSLAQLDRVLDDIMADSGFASDRSPKPGPEMVKNLFRRLRLNTHEAGLLLSLFGQVRTALRDRRETAKSALDVLLAP
ncbi:MAG: hypothetical protein H7145_00495 [Akkermansiaceae bacterium]|nr:hypothetical protein [Armatimonadota bacterium]